MRMIWRPLGKVVLVSAMAATVLAYAVPGSGADSADNQPDSTADQLGEIVVTANRRSENIQKVPIAVTAVSSDAMEQFSIRRPEDLAKLGPGLAAVPNAGTAVTAFSIRGVGQSDAAPHEEQPVAVYQDGVYVANSAATGFPIYDVQRAEVLRGPQVHQQPAYGGHQRVVGGLVGRLQFASGRGCHRRRQ
jgi:iron complex outermembrane receptor protein